MCVGFSWTGELLAVPAKVKSPDIPALASAVYDEARKRDEWPGEDYEGSSVIGGAKAVKAFGYMPEYRWGFGEEDLALAVGHHGPAVIGINWKEDMFNPDPHGVIHVSGADAGGHAILVRGILLHPHWYHESVYRLRNSWGDAWGVGGDCYVSRSDMALLLAQDGEVCVPTRRNVKPVPEPDVDATNPAPE